MTAPVGSKKAEEAATPATEGATEMFAQVADFSELHPSASSSAPGSLQHLLEVQVTVTAELGRITMTIGEVLKLGVGSILELDRPVSEPIDLMVNGVRLARGEVVVVNDRFAIRIKDIAEPRKRPLP